tara:strand:+ start:4626 stop:6974 length:2349 start_codon:yes stop_codon:yes gene_type:complete
MKKILLAILCILFSIILSNNNPKIALVLSGGGAKGIAQIPTLELIDSLNIPIDIIVGTSMGSITGATYSIGHSADEMKKMAFETNWDASFSNNKERDKLYFFQKNDHDKYRVIFELDGISPIPPIAFTNGHNSYINLNKTIGIYETITDFDNLYIPYRCNAVDLLSGNEIIFESGSLSKSLRASSSIPSVFSPVKDNDLLLVDGGVINNFPTDIANRLNADFIIGVNVAIDKKEMNDIATVFDVLSQSILLNGFKKRIENSKYADILIEPDLTKNSTLNFDYDNMIEIYNNGKKAAYSQLDDLIKLKESLNDTNPMPITLNAIENDLIIFENIIINSVDNILISDIFEFNLPVTLKKDEFLDLMHNLRQSNKYIHINYKIYEENHAYTLKLNIEKAPIRIIDKVIIKDNKKLSKSLIKDILNVKPGDILDINIIRENINNAYNLDFFESIRYEIEYNNQNTNLIFIIKESTYNKLKISGAWHNYYKIIGQMKFDLLDVPFKKFRLTDEITFGNDLRKNNINIYYINNFNFKSWMIPVIKINNIKKKVSIYDKQNNLRTQNLYNRDYSFNTIISLKKYGHIDLGLHKQKIKYQYDFKDELIKYYSLNLNIDQIDNLLYPKHGYNYNVSIEKGYNQYKYYLSKFYFDHFIYINAKSRIKLYGDAIFSDLSNVNNTLTSKSIHYFSYDRMLSFSEYNLMVTSLTSSGIELNFDYKNSTTLRFLYSYINNAEFKHTNQKITKFSSYGFGFRVKSILGPLNFMWTQTNDDLYNQSKDNYFFSLGIDY